MICSSCGSHNGNHRFCTHCGSDLSLIAAAPSHVVDSSDAGEVVRTFRNWTIIFVAFVIMVGLVWTAFTSTETTAVRADVTQAAKTEESSEIAKYRRAASTGDVDSMYMLATAYLKGQGGVNQDYKSAFDWFAKAAEQGDGRACNQLGAMYQEGLGLNRDLGEALKWYRRGHERGSSTATYNIGWAYQHGLGVNQDFAEALRWYGTAAQRGSAEAVSSIGFMHVNGLGVPRDSEEGLAWFALAASMGSESGWKNYNATSDGSTYFSQECGKDYLASDEAVAGPADGNRPSAVCIPLPSPHTTVPIDPDTISRIPH